MKSITPVILALALCCWTASLTPAQESHAPAPGGATDHAPPAAHDAAAPVVSHDDAPHAARAHDAGPLVPGPRHRWPTVFVFLVLMMFLAAAVIGPIVRAHAPPELPPTHSHDEPPGASHHHGHGGTINPVPEDVARVEEGHDHGHDHH